MKNQYDIVVIGGGHNGLTAATFLAKKGNKVLLLEKSDGLGGIAAGHEFHPGYFTNGLLHDTTGVRPWVVETLGLKKYGLQIVGHRPSYALLGQNGDGLWLDSNTQKASDAISGLSKKDGEAYLKYADFMQKIGGFITPLLNDLPPDLVNLGPTGLLKLGQKAFGLKRLGNKTMTELLKVAPMCIADFLNEYFDSNLLKSGLIYPAIHGSFTAPWSAYTTLNLLLWECSAKNYIPGGGQELIAALTDAATEAGVEIHTSAKVDKIRLNKDGIVEGVDSTIGSTACRQVVSTCTPQVTFLDLLPPNALDHTFEHDILHYRSRGTTGVINLAFRDKLKFKFDTPQAIEFARLCSDIDSMERSFDPIKYGEFSENPLLEMHIPTTMNPKLAPEGSDVLSVLVHFLPYQLKDGWDEASKQALLGHVFQQLGKVITNMAGNLVGSEILTPPDLEENYGLSHGNVFHGEHAIDQLLTRPVPKCARYDTPIPGLYICGSGAFPGGGITCAPGALGAKRILKAK